MVRTIWRAGAAALAASLIAALNACDDPGKKAAANTAERAAAAEQRPERKPLQLTPDEARRAGLQSERIVPTEVAETVDAFGTVEANRNRYARIAPPVAGRVARIVVDLGETVKAGQQLATLESPELADLWSAHRQAETELDLARSSLDRAQRLGVDGSMAQKDVLRARSDRDRAQAAFAAAEAKLAALGVSPAPSPGAPSAVLTVAAPLAGTVVERAAVLGEYAQAYQPLFAVADLSTVWVETNLYDRDLADVAVSAKATVTVRARPGQRFAGTVTYIGSTVDKETRTVKARVELANAGGILKPGMFADVAIAKASRRTALRVPEEAIVLMQGQMTAFVAAGEVGFEARPVHLGERKDGMAVVKSGLEPGDEVVVAGAYALKARLLKSQMGDAH